MEVEVLFGLMSVPVENAFLAGWCVGMGTFAILELVTSKIMKYWKF